MEFNQDFRDMLSALNDANVDFLIVGAYAVAAHGFPRATGDLDIWIRADVQTAPKVIRALTVFGAPLYDLTVADLSYPSIVFQIGVPPGRIDLLTSISGINFDDAWPRQIRVEIDGLVLPVISRSDLIANKRASGRPKDLVDLHVLERGQDE
ncbi:MAG TPA: nucleotidyltransferase [Planctomicrobium sp.]|nr:nucleotidyltransferase [Planctomicrobium sp.]